MATDLGFETPPSKRRQVLAVRASPPKVSDLLSAFGARKAPGSGSKVQRHSAGHDMRAKAAVNYAESDSSTPDSWPKSISSFEDPISSRTSILPSAESSEDELQSDEVIHVVPRPSGTRTLPPRSTRTQVSYANPAKKTKKKKNPKSKRSGNLLTSNTNNAAPTAKSARGKLRQGYLDNTVPKRKAFVLAKKDLFLPLLPETSYIDKLECLQAMDGNAQEQSIVEYVRIDQQPPNITATLKPYQLEGLSFLVYMYNNGMSPILGDEMGLGKTLQTLALFQYLKENDPDADDAEIRPHLVVCPLSVLSSWLSETRRWTPQLKVVRFHGPVSERERIKKELLQAHDSRTIDVVVTTYETFKAEAGWMKRAFAWRFAVLDEGHKIKNDKSDIAAALQSLRAEHRLLLTGTPLQNNLKEMWALLHWLLPEVFTEDTQHQFRQAFNLTEGKVSTKFMDDSRRLLELLMLRRMKSSPEVNLGLPEKTEVQLYVPLTPMQRFWYMRLLTMSDNATLEELFRGAKDKELRILREESEDVDESALTGDSSDLPWSETKQIMQAALEREQQEESGNGNKWQKLMHLITELRKICVHPYILRAALPDPYYLGEHVKAASGKFIILDKLVERLVLQKKKKILIFAGWTRTLDLCEDLLALKGGNMGSFRYLRLDGRSPRAHRNLGIRMFNDKQSDFHVMLISTRAGGLGLNLASATEVIFMDEDWNPQITLQAEARAHRIGQQDPVTVYKICTQGTVEEQMMGRIRKKLYLSAKVMESMRNIHSGQEHRGKKRKRLTEDTVDEGEEPALGTDSLKSLLRQGARTLTRPEVDITAMLDWDFEKMIEECKDKTDNVHITKHDENVDEQAWLSTMERVETTVFEGKKHHRELKKAEAIELDLSRADRRINKNTTVMIDGFAINKESLQCADWEAVPTMAGKDPRLAEPVRAKKEEVSNQSYCQHCWDGGNLVLCSGCPRSYHMKCLDKEFKFKAHGKMNFFCSQHQCVDCGAKTTEAGGMVYRCRWCERGYCEDCLDWGNVNLIGDTLTEYKMLGFGAVSQAWYVDCPSCLEHWQENEDDRQMILKERARIDAEYEKSLKQG